MARPTLVGEPALASTRAQWARDTVSRLGASRVAAMPQAAMTAAVDRLMMETRRSPDDRRKRLQRLDLVMAEERARLTDASAKMPADDVRKLIAMYESADGRAERDALVRVFRSSADSMTRMVLLDFFAKVRADEANR